MKKILKDSTVWAIVEAECVNYCMCENPDARRLALFNRRADALAWIKSHYSNGKILKVQIKQA